MENSNQYELILKLKPVLIQSILFYLTIQENRQILSNCRNEKICKASMKSLK